MKQDRNISTFFWILVAATTLMLVNTGCGVYKFNDVSIPPEVKTFRLHLIENRARYVNPQLSPALTDRVRQKIANQTRLTHTTGDNGHYDITATITDYTPSTSGVSNTDNGRQGSINRLTVTISIRVLDQLKNKTRDHSISRSFDYPATQTLQAAETALMDEMVRNLSDEIFNRIFSNW